MNLFILSLTNSVGKITNVSYTQFVTTCLAAYLRVWLGSVSF